MQGKKSMTAPEEEIQWSEIKEVIMEVTCLRIRFEGFEGGKVGHEGYLETKQQSSYACAAPNYALAKHLWSCSR